MFDLNIIVMKQRHLLFLFVVICTSLFTSCKKEELSITNATPPFEVSVDVTLPAAGYTEPVPFTTSGPKPSWGLGIDSDYIDLIFPHENDYADCYLYYQLYSINNNQQLWFEMELDYFPFEYDKVYNFEEPMEMPEVVPDNFKREIDVLFWMNPDYNETTKKGWVKFTNRQVVPPFRYVCADIEFAFDVYDDETGELLIKAENGKITSAFLGLESDYLPCISVK